MRAPIALALLLASTIAAADDKSLVGKWESIARSEGGIGSTLQLNADGSLSRTIGAMVDSTYRVDRGKLKSTYLDPDTGKSVVTTNAIRIGGDTLFEKNGGGPGVDLQMTRLTPFDLNHPIVGTWKYPHSSGSTAFVTFTEDGHELLRIPLRVDGGSWDAVGSKLTLQLEGHDPVTSAYHVEQNVLTLVEGGKEFRYRRVRY